MTEKDESKEKRSSAADDVLGFLGERLQTVSLPAVDATIDILTRLGLVQREEERGSGRSPTEESGPVDRHHFVCNRCGHVDYVDARVNTRPLMNTAKGKGLYPIRAEVVLTGLCSACQSNR